jgi:hypothetical protein
MLHPIFAANAIAPTPALPSLIDLGGVALSASSAPLSGPSRNDALVPRVKFYAFTLSRDDVLATIYGGTLAQKQQIAESVISLCKTHSLFASYIQAAFRIPGFHIKICANPHPTSRGLYIPISRTLELYTLTVHQLDGLLLHELFHAANHAWYIASVGESFRSLTKATAILPYSNNEEKIIFTESLNLGWERLEKYAKGQRNLQSEQKFLENLNVTYQRIINSKDLPSRGRFDDTLENVRVVMTDSIFYKHLQRTGTAQDVYPAERGAHFMEYVAYPIITQFFKEFVSYVKKKSNFVNSTSLHRLAFPTTIPFQDKYPFYCDRSPRNQDIIAEYYDMSHASYGFDNLVQFFERIHYSMYFPPEKDSREMWLGRAKNSLLNLLNSGWLADNNPQALVYKLETDLCLARITSHQHQYSEAVKYYDRALKFVNHPKHPVTPFRHLYIEDYPDDESYAVLLESSGRMEEAKHVRKRWPFQSPRP